ncbi:hypothetical protein [Nonomuraea sp. B19D2]
MAIAEQALAAVRAGIFTVVPDGWATGITRRQWLATGTQPDMPTADTRP